MERILPWVANFFEGRSENCKEGNELLERAEILAKIEIEGLISLARASICRGLNLKKQ